MSGSLSLSGRRVLVTGGGSGIGAAIAAGLAGAGATVRTADSDPDTEPDYECDVSDDSRVRSMFMALDADLGGLDVLVNNVGIAGPMGRVESIDPDEFDECVRVNIGGTFRCTRHAVPLLERSGGSIINIVSTAGHHGYPLRSPYSASKWGVEGLTATWAMELGERGIRVNAICPGTVRGPRMESVIEREAATVGSTVDEIRRGYEDQVSMRTLIDASDIADMAVFLAGNGARMINGQILSVDGNTETLRTVRPT